MAPVVSPNPPTDEMVKVDGGAPATGFVGLFRSAARCVVMLDRDVSGERGGKDGVKSPNFGSGSSAILKGEMGVTLTRDCHANARITSDFEPALVALLLDPRPHDGVFLHRKQQALY